MSVVALSACRRTETEQRTVAPTAIPTPISTPLPPIPTQVPAGSDDNPLRMLVNPALSAAAARTASTRLADDLSERTGLTVAVETVTTDAEALAALCESVGGVVNVAWVGGLTAAAAQAQGCGVAVLMAERGTGRNARTGEAVQLVALEDGAFATVASLANDARFCRVGYDDVQTWLVPSLILQGAGITPAQIDEVTDYEDVGAMLAAMIDGDCDAAGVPASALAGANAATRQALTVLAESVAIPYSVLVYPPEMPLAERTALQNALTDLMADTAARGPLRDLLVATALETADADALEAVADFVAEAGVSLAGGWYVVADLAVVVVTWNVRALALEALRSLYADLAASGLAADVTVVDSASSDGTAEALSAAFPQARVIASAENLGFVRANNLALREMGFGTGAADLPKAVYLLNPDTLTQPGATAALYAAVTGAGGPGLAGAQLYYEDSSFQHSAFAFPGLRQLWVELFPTPGRLIEGRFNGRYPRALYEAGRPFEVDFVLGATMMLRREVIEQTGMFDEGFFMYCEEIDWAWRIHSAGWGVQCVPAARVVHLAGQSTGQARPEMLLHLWTSRLRLFGKHWPAWKLWLGRRMIVVGMQRRLRGEPNPDLRQAYGRIIEMASER